MIWFYNFRTRPHCKLHMYVHIIIRLICLMKAPFHRSRWISNDLELQLWLFLCLSSSNTFTIRLANRKLFGHGSNWNTWRLADNMENQLLKRLTGGAKSVSVKSCCSEQRAVLLCLLMCTRCKATKKQMLERLKMVFVKNCFDNLKILKYWQEFSFLSKGWLLLSCCSKKEWKKRSHDVRMQTKQVGDAVIKLTNQSRTLQ